MIQPWFKNKFYPEPKVAGEVTLSFKFVVKTIPEDIWVMTEDENAKIAVNGVVLPKENIENGFADVCFKRINIPQNALKTGQNELKVTFSFTDRYDIESLYITGNFGVSATDEIIALPSKLALGDITARGLKFYGGRIKYFAAMQNGNYKVKLKELPAAICYFNKKAVAFMPYETEFCVTDGKLTIEVVLTRQNTFGTTIKSGKREGIIPQGLPQNFELFKQNK